MPVLNLEYGWFGSARSLNSSSYRQKSDCRFFECSDSMALTSRPVAAGVNSGAVKKPAKRSSAPGSPEPCTSKK